MIPRRSLLKGALIGMGSVSFGAWLSNRSGGFVLPTTDDSLNERPSHFAPSAKRVIFIFLTGGVSHVDTFDPKPRLIADHGKQITVDNWQGQTGEFPRYLKRPDWAFRPGGESGIEVSDLFPEIRETIDEFCVLRSMESEHTNHYESTLGMHCGSWEFARPSIGAWVSFGLGMTNTNLPAFVVLGPHAPYAGSQTWGSDFLPACHQGTHILPGANPVPNVIPFTDEPDLQALELAAVTRANIEHRRERSNDDILGARIRAMQTAVGMQQAAPEAFDLSEESESTLAEYGLQPGQHDGFGWQCIMARRLAERDVRFIELIDVGSSNNWDAHGDMKTHEPLAKNVDRPIATMIRDLRRRGLLDETLVVVTTEFGRTPYHEQADHAGREHHHQVFSSLLAGGGVRAGMVYGESDEHGIAVGSNGVHVHDLHATILHLLGMDHQQLTYRHAGRDYRLTDVFGRVVHDIIA